MATMTHRTTFALDAVTGERLRRLAALWGVSQAEVVRRAVAWAEEDVEAAARAAEAVRGLEAWHRSGGGLTAEEAAAVLGRVRADRKRWR